MSPGALAGLEGKPRKPMFGDACNGCGLCCLNAQCPLSEFLFGDHELCPALVDEGGRYTCGLVSQTDRFVVCDAAADLREAMMMGIGVSGYCDAVYTLPDRLRFDIMSEPLAAQYRAAHEGEKLDRLRHAVDHISVRIDFKEAA